MAASQAYLENEPIVNADLCKKWLFWGILWTLVFPLVGVVVSIKFNYPDWLGGVSWLTWGRIRPMHVNGVIFGAFSTTFFGLVFYMVPKLTGIRMVGEKLGYLCLWLWNIGVILGSFSLMAGYQKGIEAGDYALWADVPFFIAFLIGLLAGALRQGALDGVMADAVAAAAEVPAAEVRRAAMLRGALAPVAVTALTSGVEGLREYRLEVGRPVVFFSLEMGYLELTQRILAGCPVCKGKKLSLPFWMEEAS